MDALLEFSIEELKEIQGRAEIAMSRDKHLNKYWYRAYGRLADAVYQLTFMTEKEIKEREKEEKEA